MVKIKAEFTGVTTLNMSHLARWPTEGVALYTVDTRTVASEHFTN